MNTSEKLKNLLMEEVKEKMQSLPFGFGQEEGCEGFPKWSVYVSADNQLYGHPSLTSSFDKDKTILENISSLPLDKLTLLAEKGLSGQALFNEMHENYMLGNGMGGTAWEDAKQWKEQQGSRMKP